MSAFVNMKELLFMRVELKKKFNTAEKFLDRLQNLQFMIFCFASVIFFSLLVLSEGHNWGGDFSQYLAQSRAILNGEISSWLEKQSFIISESTPGFSPLIYPWMTAIILLPAYSLFGMNFFFFKLTEIFLLAAAWIIFFLFVKQKENVKVAAILTSILMFNAHYIFLTDNILSECPFLFFSFLAIFLFYRREKNFKLYGAAIGAAIFFAVNTRTLGVALLIALLLEDFFSLLKEFSPRLNKKKFAAEKIFPRSVPYLTYEVLSVIFSWLLPTVTLQNNTGYLVTFSLNLSDIFAQAIYYAKLFGIFFLPDVKNIWSQNFDGVLIYFALIIWGALAIIGAAKNFLANRFLIFYIGVTLATVISFGAHAGIRYIFGIIPFVFYFAFLAVKNFEGKKIMVVVLLAITLFFSATSILIFNLNGGTSNQAYTKEAEEVYNFINKNISDDKIIFFFKPRVLYLNTNNRTYFKEADEEDSLKSADFVLLTEGDYYPELKKILESNSTKYKKIFGNGKFNLYEVMEDF